jgi:hypothetical protein
MWLVKSVRNVEQNVYQLVAGAGLRHDLSAGASAPIRP